jgi:LysR family transcriptional regulator, low CO2-responsive transcriptional regulator
MDFDQLETFLEVARNLSFSRAAEKRFRTQPAISAQIRAIEEDVGARLLDRTGGKVSITAAGKVFLVYVESARDPPRAAMRAVAEAERVPGGEIVVAANEGSCLHILPDVFAEFKRNYPDVGITVKRSETRETLEAIIDNSADFGVAAMPVNDKRITSVVIHKDELVVITPTGHPLAKFSEIKVSEIANYPLLVPKLGRTRDSIDRMFEERGMKPNISMELDSSELLKRFVSAGVGIGFCPYLNALGDLRLGITAVIKMSDAQIRRDMALVFRKDKALSRASLAFIDIAVRLKSPQSAHK